MRVFDDIIFNDTVNNETVNGESVSLEHLPIYSVHAVWTGASANGTAVLQVSNDQVTWADYDGSETTISGPGNQFWDHLQTGAKYIRLSITSADTNNIVVTANIHAKGA
jgi:hypothetical protein